MEKDMIRKLFDGEIDVSENIKLKSKEAKEVMKQFEEEYEYFKKKLSEDDLEKFEDFRDTILAYSTEYGIECFSYGLGLGIRMTTETAEHFE